MPANLDIQGADQNRTGVCAVTTESRAKSSRAREQVTPDFKPEPTPKREPKRLKRTGFRSSPTLAAQFRFAVLHEFGGRCVMAGQSECSDRLDAHHAIGKQALRKRGLEAQLWNPANGIALCRRHHDLQERRLVCVPRELLPPSIEEFAKAHGLSYLLDKLYERSTG